jgi:hypothetical protein
MYALIDWQKTTELLNAQYGYSNIVAMMHIL